MVNIFKADLYRMTKSKSFYLYWFCIIITYLISIVSQGAGGIQLGLAINTEMKMDLQMVAMNFTFFYLFLFPVYGLVVCDFNEKTIKNTISSAIGRKEYFIAKFVITEVYTILSFVVSNLLFYVVNRVVNGDEFSSPFLEFWKALCYQLPMMTGVVAILILVAFLVKKMGIFNAVTMLSPMLYTTIALTVYQAGEEEFATECLLKYELSTVLSQVVSTADTAFIRNCSIIGLAAVVFSFIIGYMSFTKFEMNS